MWKVIKEEFKYLKNKRWGIFALILLLFVPSVYGGVFLTAFKRPMHNMDHSRIAVVNLDKKSNDLEQSFIGKHELKTATDKLYMTIEGVPSYYDSQSAIEEAVNKDIYQGAFIISEGFEVKLKDFATKILKTRDIKDSDIPKVTFYVSYKTNYLQAELLEMRSQIISLHKSIIRNIINSQFTVMDSSKILNVLDHNFSVLQNKIVEFHSIGTAIDDYGQGMFPYFFSIALWAGCVMMVFMFKNHRPGKIAQKAGTFKNYFSRSVFWLITGWMQSLMLVLVAFITGLVIDTNAFYLIMYTLLVSTMFSMIVQGISFLFRAGEFGSFIVLILLVTQLVSGSGTFPVEMQVGIFNWIHPLLPFTYTIDSFREFLYHPDIKQILSLQWPILIYLLIVPIALSVNYVIDKKKKKKYGEYKSHEINFHDE